MKHLRRSAPLALFATAVACGSVPSETSPPPGGRELAPSGVIRGTVVYSGPHPCSQAGHVVGAAIVFVFDRRNPPPPNGTASTAVNLGVVAGDALFADEPRNPGADVYCPADHGVTETITRSAPFAISPLDGGSYTLASFYDYTGDFLPGFSLRRLPEQGDIAGGYIDTADALEPGNAGNPDYEPRFLPVDVGVAQPLPKGAPAFAIPSFVVPPQGFVADNVTVTLGQALPLTRPYFYPQGLQVHFDTNAPADISTSVAQSSDQPAANTGSIAGTLETDPNYAPILTMPQDIAVLAPPQTVSKATVNNYEAQFPHLRLEWAVPGPPSPELALATDPGQPFRFQLPAQGGGFQVWQNATLDPATQKWVSQQIPEGNDIPSLWPLVVLTRLVDDPGHKMDPASLTQQGDAHSPVVVLQAITLLGDSPTTGPESLFDTVTASTGGLLFDAQRGQPALFRQDHLTVLLRPSVICFGSLFDPTALDKRGILVTPYLFGSTADLPTPVPSMPLVAASALSNPPLSTLVSLPAQACLPTGRYAINVVYPDSQAWTVPNEAGACSGTEGPTDYGTLRCKLAPNRSILYSQGNRAVVEIVPAAAGSGHCQGSEAVPPPCLPH